MNKLIALLLVCLPVYGEQSFLPKANASITFPAGYPAITTMSLEVAFDVVGNCLSATSFSAGNRNPNIITITMINGANHVLGIGCLTVGSKAISIGQPNGNPGVEVITDDQMNGIGTVGGVPVTTLVVRLSRDYANDRRIIEAWDQDGNSLFPSPYYVVAAGGPSSTTIPSFAAPATRTMLLSESGMLKVRWARLKSTIPSSFGTLIPAEPAFGTAGDLGNWNLDTANITGTNTISDSSIYGLTITHTGSTCSPSGLSNCFSSSLTPAGTIVQAFASAGNAGELVTLNGASSFNWSATAITNPTWQWVSGPARAILSSASTLNTTALYPVAGDHVFRLSIGEDSREVTIPIANLDIGGYYLMPSNLDYGSFTQGFRLADVPNATYVKLRVRKPSGGEYPAVTATTSPATIRIDKRQAFHWWMPEYYSASNQLLAQGEWQLMPVTATELDVVVPLKSAATIYGGGTLTGRDGDTTPRTDIVPFVFRYWDRAYGVDYEENVISQVTRPGGALISSYTDFCNLAPYQITERVHTTPALGLNYEPAFSHMNVDYEMPRHKATGSGHNCSTSSWVIGELGSCWKNMDRFDVGEGSTFGDDGSGNLNGVMQQSSGGTLTDVTRAADTPSTTSDTFTISANLLIAYFEPFDEINWDVSTGAAGNTITPYYCSAISGTGTCSTWSALTLTTDTTASGGQKLFQDGRWRFTPPSNWVKSKESGSWYKWWVRVVTAGTGTAPTVIRIYGDNWMPEPVSAGPGRYLTPYTHFAAGDGATFTGLSIAVSPAYTCPAAPCTAVWQYWNGTAWTTLTTSTDTTTGGTATGSVTWTAPGDWAANSFNGSGSTARKWVRIIRYANGALQDTYQGHPITGTVTATGGTSSVAVSTLAARGWDSTHVNRVNVGLGALEYNPNPPSTATARFQYQARFLNHYAPDYAMTSPLNNHTDGKRAWAHAALNGAKEHAANRPAMAFNAVFYDDIITNPTGVYIMYPAATSSGPGWNQADGTYGYAQALTDLMSLVPSVMPGTNIGGNGADWNLCKLIDSCKEEGQFGFTVQNPWRLYRDDTENTTWLHDARVDYGVWSREYDRAGDPADNPLDTVISIAYVESRQTYSVGSGNLPRNGGSIEAGKILWDRGNRGPVSALAYHYLANNDQTRFAYNTQNVISLYLRTSQVKKRNTNPTWYLNTAMVYVSDAVGYDICFDGYEALADRPIASGVAYEVMVGTNWLKFFKESGSTCGSVPYSDLYGPDAQLDPLGHAIGTPIYETSTCYLGTECAPPAEEVYLWSWVFPAMGIDLGDPLEDRICYAVTSECTDNDPAHLYTGVRWPMFKRAFDNAVVVGIISETGRSKLSEYTDFESTVYNFNTEGWCTGSGCALYPLKADGKTDNTMCNYTSIGGSDYRTADGGCTAMRVRKAAEGYILMRERVN